MKLLACTVGAVLVSAAAMANPLDDFRQDGQTGGYLDLDFHMEPEARDAFHASELNADAGASAAIALASIPHATGEKGAIGVGIGKYGTGRALSLGYGNTVKNINYQVGVTVDSRDEVAAGVGMSYNF